MLLQLESEDGPIFIDPHYVKSVTYAGGKSAGSSVVTVRGPGLLISADSDMVYIVKGLPGEVGPVIQQALLEANSQ